MGTSPVPHRVRLIIILGALSAFGPLSLDMYLPALPSLAQSFGASVSAAQITLSACLVGLALGQVLAGPLSDAVGRRRPLLVGVAAYALASLLCVFAPSIGAFALLRLMQGVAGAAGIVIARAIVRDLFAGVEAAKVFSLLMLVNGLAPILAPVFGGQLLRLTSWRGVFATLAVVGVLLLLAALLLPETLADEHRQSGGVGATLRTFRTLLGDGGFMRYALSCGLAFSSMFAYISGSSFVLQDLYGVSPQAFSMIFGANALGLMVVGQVSGRLVGRVSPRRLLGAGLAGTALGGVALLAVVLAGAGLWGILPALFVVVASMGLVLPNATTLALSGHPRMAGSASALIGVLQYALGAAAAPFVGLGGGTSALPMAAVMAALGCCALGVFALLGRAPAVGRAAELSEG
ncbi:multidrug effflux MFS transporter [Chloroflexia bacterium SDU3-3]|nr:multidrug effflux MFS transporter [Chloroflexia bacterium SDU3-3]